MIYRYLLIVCVCCLVSLVGVRDAKASASLCPGCYLQNVTTGCVLGYEDVTLCSGCTGIAAAHAATQATLQSFFMGVLGIPQIQAAVNGAPPATISVGAIGTHAWFVQQEFMVNGLIAALQGMSKQISVGHQKQAEIMSTIVTAEMVDDAKRALQKKELEATMASLPSEGACEYGSMSGGLLSAEAQAESLSSQWQRALLSNALGEEGAATADTNAEAERVRLSVMCQYVDPDTAGGSLEQACQGNMATNDEDASRFILAQNLQQYSLDSSDMEPINLAMSSMFLDDQPENLKSDLFENDTVKIAYMDHRSVLARQMLETYCFRKTFEDKQGGSSSSQIYQDAFLTRIGLDPQQIQQRLGSNPSAYAQKKLMIDMVSDPELAMNLVDDTENILRLSDGIQSIKMATLYDTLEILHCKELMLSQLVNHKLRPVASELQERIDVLNVRIQKDKGLNKYAQKENIIPEMKEGI